MRISDWSSDVCSSDLAGKKGFAFSQDPSFEQDTVFGFVVTVNDAGQSVVGAMQWNIGNEAQTAMVDADKRHAAVGQLAGCAQHGAVAAHNDGQVGLLADFLVRGRSEEPTSDLQSLMRHSYALFCFKQNT